MVFVWLGRIGDISGFFGFSVGWVALLVFLLSFSVVNKNFVVRNKVEEMS